MDALALRLLAVATSLPVPLLALVLQHLPGVESARLASIHKKFWRALQLLRNYQPGRRHYAQPLEWERD